MHTLKTIALKIYHIFVNQTTSPITQVPKSPSENLLCLPPFSFSLAAWGRRRPCSESPSWWRQPDPCPRAQPGPRSSTPHPNLAAGRGWCALVLQQLEFCFAFLLFINQDMGASKWSGLLAGGREGGGVRHDLSLAPHFQNSPWTFLYFQEILMVRSSVSPSFTLLIFFNWR